MCVASPPLSFSWTVAEVGRSAIRCPPPPLNASEVGWFYSKDVCLLLHFASLCAIALLTPLPNVVQAFLQLMISGP